MDGKPSEPRSSLAGAARPFLLAVLLITVVCLVYMPAWHGTLLWDDEGHVTKPELRSVEGLKRIWFEVGATQQYYPLLHTAFWLQHRLFGDSTVGYHMVTIVLHALCALLAAAILLRLQVPGACLAAAIFALHPVHVESVAWICEQKNTLSGAFYLASMLLYLHFDDERRRRQYLLASALFVLAVLSKSTTATLPAALLLIIWWRRGRLQWRWDVLPLAPWFVAGAGAGLFTAWVEHDLIGASGADFNFSVSQRAVIASRAVIFYASKLFWPERLTFNYPRWDIPSNVGWQALFPLGVAALTAGLWLFRGRSRAPLAAWLFFCAALFPSLGFFNAYPFIYSFVADHFQYLASLGLISIFSAAIVRAFGQRDPRPGRGSLVVGLALVSVLGVLSWRQSRNYADPETLYRETILRNPGSWLASGNLCNALTKQKRFSEAVPLCAQAVRIKPDSAVTNNIMGSLLGEMGRFEEALPFFLEATRLNRHEFLSLSNLSLALQKVGRSGEAVVYGKEAVRLNSRDFRTRSTLCLALAALGRLPEAEEQCRRALQLDAASAEAHANLGVVLGAQGALREAALQYRDALRLSPDTVAYLNASGVLQGRQGDFQGAAAAFEKAIRHSPNSSELHNNLGFARENQGRIEAAIEHYSEALRLDPENRQASANLKKALIGQTKSRRGRMVRGFGGIPGGVP